MPSFGWSSLLTLLVVLSCYAASERSGRCPPLHQWGICPTSFAKCDVDEDCSRPAEKCCGTPCGASCVKPLYTGCEQVQMEAERRARSLGADGMDVRIPKCNSEGDFDQIQCDAASPVCWCVDETGFEVSGTRAPARNLVNCTNPNPCASHTCRMLCPHGFALARDGCPMCQCRDPCSDVKCPGALKCQLEDIACARQPCPPVPRCKRGRSLENVCPAGEPLTITGSARPFLCGTSPGKPTCPPLFQCLVQSGNDYGVCCPASFKLQKPGSCPKEEELSCGSHCEHDLECPSMQKCCQSVPCGSHCTQPQNVTVCLQQKMLAELLVMNEREGKGYIPQCSPNTGLFEAKQCSRNGLVCWCVDSNGNKLRGSMGSEMKVQCQQTSQLRAQGRSASDSCDRNICAQVCEYGFKVDPSGCPTCECDNPCDGFTCGPGEECVASKAEGCTDFLCPTSPSCWVKVDLRNPCVVGSPLDDPLNGAIVKCSPDNEDSGCPITHTCTSISSNAPAVCCAKVKTVDSKSTKEGMCPFLTLNDCRNLTSCGTDETCEGDMKCCYTGMCGAVCADTLRLNPKIETQSPTMCEYLRDFSEKMEGTRDGMGLALPPPACQPNGAYKDTQCRKVDGVEECWCVDSFGTEIPNTRSNSSLDCEAVREELSCLDLTCRMGCDYGFELDPVTRCPLCECRNPCIAVTCPESELCQMVEVNCEGEYCASVPACLPKKAGQCPYLIPVTSGSCEYECSSDTQCNGSSKCCSNGCGTQCVEPVIMTACQHQRAILEHKAHESGIPARQLFLPQCKVQDGSYEKVQCHPGTRQCWCVDERGEELPGTRAPPDVQPSCQAMTECPMYKCSTNCNHGYRLDGNGCRTCACRDPCESLSCRGEGESCRLVEVACVDQPCPPVPMCLPRRENPCQSGHPLLVRGSVDVLQCGPKGSHCPSSHKCHLSPLGEYAVCCPKPRDICFEPVDQGPCEAIVPRWFFNSETNECRRFSYGGCGGNQNNFENEEVCHAVCPVLSQCERLREKNQKSAEKYKKATFTPRCDPETGNWEPVQCLEQVGVCWCVNRNGEPIKGSLKRGVQPNCSFRQARRRMHNQQPDFAIEDLLKEVALLAAEEDSLMENPSLVGAATRCQALREKMATTNVMYAVDCDVEGRFAPTQCYARNQEKFPECWCVDEAGNQLPNTTTFKRGDKICLPTPVEAVEVKLGFQGSPSKSLETEILIQMKDILTKLGARLRDDLIEIQVHPDATYIRFAVIGTNKVNVAYYLEQMVKSQQMILDVDDNVETPLVADITKSQFHHSLPDDSTNKVAISDRVIALEHREIVSQSTVSEVTPYQTAIIVLCAGSAFIICILILVIVLYRKKMSSGMDESINQKTAGLAQHFLTQNPPIYVVSLPSKEQDMKDGQRFTRPRLTTFEKSHSSTLLSGTKSDQNTGTMQKESDKVS